MNIDLLVQRFQNKDMAAFEKLHALYAENIFGVIHTIIKDQERAEELCQDVFGKRPIEIRR